MTSTAALDRSLLAKVLSLIGSPSDGEALAAARRAHEMVHREGLTWPDLLAMPSATPASEPFIAPQEIEDGFGNVLVPPYGTTWREAVRFMLESHAAGGDRDRWLLDKAAVLLAGRGLDRRPLLSGRQALDLCLIYDAFRARSAQQ